MHLTLTNLISAFVFNQFDFFWVSVAFHRFFPTSTQWILIEVEPIRFKLALPIFRFAKFWYFEWFLDRNFRFFQTLELLGALPLLIWKKRAMTLSSFCEWIHIRLDLFTRAENYPKVFKFIYLLTEQRKKKLRENFRFPNSRLKLEFFSPCKVEMRALNSIWSWSYSIIRIDSIWKRWNGYGSWMNRSKKSTRETNKTLANLEHNEQQFSSFFFLL